MNSIKSIALVFSLAVSLLASTSQARIIGLVGEDIEQDELVKIQILGKRSDVKLKLTYRSTSIGEFRASIAQTSISDDGKIQNPILAQEPVNEDRLVYLIFLFQDPGFDESDFFNYYAYPEEIAKQKSLEYDAKMAAKYVHKDREMTFSLRQDIVGSRIKSEYVEEVLGNILDSKIQTLIVIQERKSGDSDMSFKYIQLNGRNMSPGDYIYQSKP